MEKYKLTAILLENHSELSLIIEADEAEIIDEINLTTCISGITISANNDGYFQAFQAIRDQLLLKGYGIKCIGSMLNVTQSAMASTTDKVYIITLGEQARLEDLRSLYEYADISVFPDTNDQNNYFQEWIKSLK